MKIVDRPKELNPEPTRAFIPKGKYAGRFALIHSIDHRKRTCIAQIEDRSSTMKSSNQKPKPMPMFFEIAEQELDRF